MTDKKTPRSAQTRETEERRKPWQPPSQLDAPPCPDGYKQRWLRLRVNGADDTKNINARLREGWELVRADEIPKVSTLLTTEVSKLMRVSSVWVTCYWQECQWRL